ncbi:MAG: hypothetical protein MZV65_50360 [Chromatiales bacterium]|nr:hypothetical protein [Chromatiales bacterium]
MRLEVNPRLKAVTCCIAISSLLLSACASGPIASSGGSAQPTVTGPAPIDTTYLPRLMLPGATISEVKSLALGAARSRGWSIRYADSTNDRLVVGRPAEPSVMALAAPNTGTMPGSTLEVTTLLKDYGGGIEVATLAELVTPGQAGSPATRIDYTDPLRDTLMQSLDSLRERWIRDRERLARAAPPLEGWKSAWDESPAPSGAASAPAAGNTQVAAQSTPPAPVTPAAPAQTPAPRTDASTTPAMPTPTWTDSSIPRPTYTRRPTSEPRSGAPGAAPVVDASSNPNSRPMPEPAPMPTTMNAPRDNMMSLPRADSVSSPTATGSRALWSANAEQYARQRGCQVAGSGSQLIESRQDGEVYKVPCQGSDSFLIRCQGGTCQGLL